MSGYRPVSPSHPGADVHTRISTPEHQLIRSVEFIYASSARGLCYVCSRRNTQCAAIAGYSRAGGTTTPPLDLSGARRIYTGAISSWCSSKAELAGTCRCRLLSSPRQRRRVPADEVQGGELRGGGRKRRDRIGKRTGMYSHLALGCVRRDPYTSRAIQLTYRKTSAKLPSTITA